FEEQMREGFLTIPGGHRVGLAGHVVYEHGVVKTMRYLSGLNIRISHEIKGCSDKLMPFVVLNTVILPTLIIAPPGGGKTTLLRDFVRNLSRQCNVAVVDERSEIAGCYMGISQRDLGSFCDVLDGCKKADGVRMMIRSMAPQVVAVDEIGTSEDIAALSYALTSGCSLLATIHGETLSQVRQKKEFQAVFENRMFERYILLDNLFHPGKCLAVYDKEGKTIWK
ncbi:MAG: stage III sporulation protein AA, partial [Eubacterium sp.]|nr:stage III sporulation protein AA [Eubacterium sp.]